MPPFVGWVLNRRERLISAGRLLNIEEITWALIRGGRLKNAGRLIGSLRYEKFVYKLSETIEHVKN